MDSIEKFFFGVDVNTVEGGMSEYAKNFDIALNGKSKHITISAQALQTIIIN